MKAVTTIVEVVQGWRDAGGDHEAAIFALGISRATYFRYMTQARAQGMLGPVQTPTAVAPAPVRPAPVFLASGPQAFPAQVQQVQVPPQAPVMGVPVHVEASVVQAPVQPAPSPLMKAQVPNLSPEGGARIGRNLDGSVDVGDLNGLVDLTPYLVPANGETQAYKPRRQYLDKLLNLYNEGGSAFLFGEAGTGKTSLARHLAYLKSVPFLEISCDVLLGFQELFGSVNIVDGTSYFREGLFLKFIAEPSVIIIDEVTSLDPAKSFKLHQILNSGEVFVKESDGGRGRTYRVHPQCFIVLAGNPPTARYNGTSRVNVALLDRPHSIMEIAEFTDAELDGILPDSSEKAYLLRYYRESRELISKQNVRTTFSIRSMKRIMALTAKGWGIEDSLTDGFLNAVKLTAGADAFKALKDLAEAIWDFETGKHKGATKEGK